MFVLDAVILIVLHVSTMLFFFSCSNYSRSLALGPYIARPIIDILVLTRANTHG